jgi:threonine synthase
VAADFQIHPVRLLPHPGRPGVEVVAEHLLPTGSFKIRGAEAVLADAVALGASRVALESSGNAGLAVAYLAARAGLPAIVRVARTISPGKERLLRAAGATLEIFPTREEAARAGRRDRESYDASHVRNPLFRRGVSTLVDGWCEIRELPEEIYLPVGNGSLLLGIWEGVRRARAAGRAAHAPRLIAVQSQRCAPIARPEAPGDGVTIADGCAILHPPHREEILAAIAESGGAAVAVTESEIEAATRRAREAGFPIEPTAGLGFAAAERFHRPSTPAAVIATGAASKSLP